MYNIVLIISEINSVQLGMKQVNHKENETKLKSALLDNIILTL